MKALKIVTESHEIKLHPLPEPALGRKYMQELSMADGIAAVVMDDFTFNGLSAVWEKGKMRLYDPSK